MTSFAVSSGRRVPFEDSTCFFIGSKFRCMRNTPTEHDTLTALWVQVWVQLKKEKWLPISRKRHQMGHLDFRSSRLLTEGLLVRIYPGEPNLPHLLLITPLSRIEFWPQKVGQVGQFPAAGPAA